jgi:2-polyprenyl-6-methoxyphenol hydroxylase-like FAD-dependent oxidoreductase
MSEVAIVGGGPAGLCLAIALTQQGVPVSLFERGALGGDKACGEGLMPKGLEVLERLGVRPRIDPAFCTPFRGIRYVQEDGSSAEAPVPGGGLGIRRTALMAALVARATELGVDLRAGSPVRGHRLEQDRVVLLTDQGERAYRLLVAADGLGSPTRKAAGLDLPTEGPGRYGLRQHFRLGAWSDCVEIHFGPGAEAYVTPAGPERIGVAFLFTRSAHEQVDFASLLARFPVLGARLAGATPDSEPRGAGPFLRRARAPGRGRLVLLGDAAGYVDAITGEGLSLAFQSAASLAEAIPRALAGEHPDQVLWRWGRSRERAYHHYALWAHGLLEIARRPMLRRGVIRWLGRKPQLFSWFVRQAVG